MRNRLRRARGGRHWGVVPGVHRELGFSASLEPGAGARRGIRFRVFAGGNGPGEDGRGLGPGGLRQARRVMSLEIVAYRQEMVAAVGEFNQRLLAGGGLLAGGALADQQFPETPDPGWMPGMELFLAVEGSMVRGGYILRRQNFSVGGATLPPAPFGLPLSEGIVNRSVAMLSLLMVRDA